MIIRANNRQGLLGKSVAILCCIYLTCVPVTAFAPTPLLQRHPSVLQAVAKSGGKLIRTEEEFAKNVLSPKNVKPIMVFFTAPWCGPCRLSIPVVKEVLQKFKSQIDVLEVCTDDLPEVASSSGVVSIPTIQLYYKGTVLDTIVGCVAANVLTSSVEKALEDVIAAETTKKSSGKELL